MLRDSVTRVMRRESFQLSSIRGIFRKIGALEGIRVSQALGND